MENDKSIIFTDNSKIVTEALVESGADVFIGYPITPANLLYQYASSRFQIFMAAPDEITTLQWMTGFSATGKIPVTATSFPGFALMIESINMAYMMELPMIIILVQRLGPATGTATTGAQGDIALLNGMISGGMTLPTFNFSNSLDCWDLSSKAVEFAVKHRTPVVILTSKEEMMTKLSLDINQLKNISKIEREYYDSDEPYFPYKAEKNLVPPFLPLANEKHQVRITASTHNTRGIIQNSTVESMNNSKRLHFKNFRNMADYCFYDLDEQERANTILISYGITALATKEAVFNLRTKGKKVSLLIAKTLLPIPQIYFDVATKYEHIIVAEENLTGQYKQILFGNNASPNVTGVNEFGKMINPNSIIKEVMKYV
jgi:2-oxoglutarate/2-oxoacid ferredoxin oxidoreductase subunit alpha